MPYLIQSPSLLGEMGWNVESIGRTRNAYILISRYKGKKPNLGIGGRLVLYEKV
jgi:hypothetical protein